jgi:hypothetical protein
MQLEVHTLVLSPLRAGRGDLERMRLGALFGDSPDPDAVQSKVPLSLSKRVMRVRLECIDTVKATEYGFAHANGIAFRCKLNADAMSFYSRHPSRIHQHLHSVFVTSSDFSTRPIKKQMLPANNQ